MILFFNTILSQNDTKMIKSIHDFSVTDIYGKNFDFNNSNKTNSSTDAEIEEEENTNTYFKPIIITKGNNKEKEA